MLFVVTVIFLMMAAFGASVVVALCWAARHGEFSHMEEKSKVIFDPEEPVGTVTDSFPVRVNKKTTLKVKTT